MTRSEMRGKRREVRDRVRAYLRAPSAQPLIFADEEGLCPCEALFSAPLWGLRLAVKFVVIWVALLAIMPGFVTRWLLRRVGMKIGRGVCIAPRVSLDPLFPSLITIGEGCVLGEGARVFAHEYTASNLRIGAVTIGPGSVIGGYSTIRSGITIGRGVTVGFNSYVNKSVPDGVTVGGVPARVLHSNDKVE